MEDPARQPKLQLGQLSSERCDTREEPGKVDWAVLGLCECYREANEEGDGAGDVPHRGGGRAVRQGDAAPAEHVLQLRHQLPAEAVLGEGRSRHGLWVDECLSGD